MRALLILGLAMPLLAYDPDRDNPRRRWDVPDYRKHNVTVGLGAGLPKADLAPFFSNAVGFGFGYGYRFLPWAQADIGLETVFGAAGVRDFFESQFGPLRIRDFQWFLPIGGRVILPLADGRVLLHGGGGFAYLRYGERLQQPFQGSNFRLACPVCDARDGVGSYVTAGVSTFLDRGRHFRVGVSGRRYQGRTDGDPLGAVPGVRTRDQWINVQGEFGFSF